MKARAFASSLDPSAVAEQDYTITQGDIYNGDGTLTAAITSPGDGGQVTQPTTVSALITRSGVSSSKSVAWSFYTRLSGAAASNDPWIPIGSGTIVGGSGDPTTVTAQFDPTLRINGLCGVTVARGGGIGLL